MTALDALVRSLQKEAWRLSEIEDRLEDQGFPFSGRFDPPAEIEEAIARLLVLTGTAVGRPIIRCDLLTTVYQEKLSPPIFYNAWFRLEEAQAIPATLRLGEEIFLASAPTGLLYPVTYREAVSHKLAIVFDANLLLFARIFLTSVVKICAATQADTAPGDGFWIKWGENFTVDRTLAQILKAEDATRNIATLLLNTVHKSLPYSDNLDRLDPSPKEELLLALLIDDLFTYMIGHEVAHIKAGHLARHPGASDGAGLGHDTNATRERLADLHGFGLLANTIPQAAGNFRVYIHTAIVFHMMAFLYRSVHALHFRRDYGNLPPQVMSTLYFPPDHLYPHPLTRLFSLRNEVRAQASTLREDINAWDHSIDTFFENLWKPVYLQLLGAKQPVASQWRYIVDLHQIAYDANGFRG